MNLERKPGQSSKEVFCGPYKAGWISGVENWFSDNKYFLPGKNSISILCDVSREESLMVKGGKERYRRGAEDSLLEIHHALKPTLSLEL